MGMLLSNLDARAPRHHKLPLVAEGDARGRSVQVVRQVADVDSAQIETEVETVVEDSYGAHFDLQPALDHVGVPRVVVELQRQTQHAQLARALSVAGRWV